MHGKPAAMILPLAGNCRLFAQQTVPDVKETPDWISQIHADGEAEDKYNF